MGRRLGVVERTKLSGSGEINPNKSPLTSNLLNSYLVQVVTGRPDAIVTSEIMPGVDNCDRFFATASDEILLVSLTFGI